MQRERTSARRGCVIQCLYDSCYRNQVLEKDPAPEISKESCVRSRCSVRAKIAKCQKVGRGGVVRGLQRFFVADIYLR